MPTEPEKKGVVKPDPLRFTPEEIDKMDNAALKEALKAVISPRGGLKAHMEHFSHTNSPVK
jgi:hypothetical protein